MEVIIAKESGLCYGVKRALPLAKEARNRKTGGASTLPEAIQDAVAKIKSSYRHQFLSEKRIQCQS